MNFTASQTLRLEYALKQMKSEIKNKKEETQEQQQQLSLNENSMVAGIPGVTGTGSRQHTIGGNTAGTTTNHTTTVSTLGTGSITSHASPHVSCLSNDGTATFTQETAEDIANHNTTGIVGVRLFFFLFFFIFIFFLGFFLVFFGFF